MKFESLPNAVISAPRSALSFPGGHSKLGAVFSFAISFSGKLRDH
ncbi:hypothetical protein EBL_c18680 [Shimwellia blattae DSM 4481 = NBRC 105725]|uniref:Uncharacterized protein n=1 Tax=Shimwellia blattae (strain ATCC 29907 / DSM 4481 / JCM 1650 / NBRC 105725 / CDC 9005-74) TaxID=630626 RepID=I2B8V8_SHIBC|nr:hypothetical protein EBL_c18680 [Shimwellia blattae DSM 4481 = NBRC 105725]